MTSYRHDRQEQHEREGRKYLAALRTLTEIEFAAREVATRFQHLPTTATQREAVEQDCADLMRSQGASTIVLETNPQAVIELPKYAVADTENRTFFIRKKRVMIPVSSTAFMLADMVDVLASGDHVGAESDAWELKMELSNYGAPFASVGRARAFGDIRRESVDTWIAWMGDDTLDLIAVRASVVPIAVGMEEQSLRAARYILLSHPEFGEEYVRIRSAIVTEWSQTKNPRAVNAEAEAEGKRSEQNR